MHRPIKGHIRAVRKALEVIRDENLVPRYNWGETTIRQTHRNMRKRTPEGRLYKGDLASIRGLCATLLREGFSGEEETFSITPSLPEIAYVVGYARHSSVIYAIRSYTPLIKKLKEKETQRAA